MLALTLAETPLLLKAMHSEALVRATMETQVDRTDHGEATAFAAIEQT